MIEMRAEVDTSNYKTAHSLLDGEKEKILSDILKQRGETIEAFYFELSWGILVIGCNVWFLKYFYYFSD